MNSDTEIQDFIDKIDQLYEKLNSGDMDYFALLGLTRTAITRDIENAYQRCALEFSEQRIAKLSDPDLRKKADFVAQKVQRAREVLMDYDQRAVYEQRGFREQRPEDLPDEDPAEIAKNLYRKAKTLYTRQDYAMTISALEKAIHCDPTKPDYYYLMGVCQTRIPTLKREAEKNLLKAVEMEPWNAEHYAALGMLFYSERLLSRAESYFRQALDRESSHAMARKKLEEIVGPEKKPMDSVKEGLHKAFPSIFGKKKK
jgi:tetratricopeptide (TPR) repeat protein